MPDDALLTSLLAAVDAHPADVPLRLHVADLLASRDRLPEALQHCTQALAVAPSDPAALTMLQRLTATISRPLPAQLVDEGARRFDWQQAEQQVGPHEQTWPTRLPQPGGQGPDQPAQAPEFAQEYQPDPVTEDVERLRADRTG